MPLDRPIPAFYCCYLLRSTVRHGSVYVGSTPNPVRRLRQHNGLAKGGAVRTSRDSLRPWEMACIVTGFPSHIAALQFEWAWQNPHVTLHIPSESRIQHSTQKKRSGQPKRPRHSTTSLLSNLHLLLRVPSFSRWPLELRFFTKDVHKSWLRWCKTTAIPVRDTITIIQDFNDDAAASGSEGESSSKTQAKSPTNSGIYALSVDYTEQKSHVEKSKEIIDFEMEGKCTLCDQDLEHDGGMYTVCTNKDCNNVTHMSCLSKHFLAEETDDLIPITGTCPSCKSELKWVDVVKELSLRMRGQKELEQLLKVKRARKKKEATTSQAISDNSDDEDDAEAADMEEEMEMLNQFDQAPVGSQVGDGWHDAEEADNMDDSDNASASSNIVESRKAMAPGAIATVTSKTVIEDSDWDDAIEI